MDNLNNNLPIAPVYIPEKKVYNPLKKKDKIFLFIALFVCFIMVDFALFGGFKLGFTVAYFILFLATTVYLAKKDNKLSIFTIFVGALSLLASVTFAISLNDLMTFLMSLLVAGLYSVYALSLSDSFKNSKGSFKMLFDVLLSIFPKPFSSIPVIVGSLKAGTKRDKKSVGAVIGICVSVPVLGVIIPLLVKSDVAFAGLVSSVIKKLGQYVMEFILAAIVFPFGYSFLFSMRNKKEMEKPNKKQKNYHILPYSACVSFLTVISLTYVVYLMSQLAYFFSAFSNLLPEGYTNTASEFARRGFYEMFAVCVINTVMITVTNMFLKRPKSSLSLKFLSLFIIMFSLLLIVIAMRKMILNIHIYGMTSNRILVFTLMCMMLVVLAFFIIHQFAPRVQYMQCIIVICSALFVALAFSNVDAMVGRYNTQAYEKGTIENLDMDAIEDLGDNGIPFICELALEDNVNGEIARDIIMDKLVYDYRDEIELSKKKITVKESSDFRSYSVSHHKALAAFEEYSKALASENKHSAQVFANRCYMKGMENAYEYEDGVYYIYDDPDHVYKINPKTDFYEKVENTEKEDGQTF